MIKLKPPDNDSIRQTTHTGGTCTSTLERIELHLRRRCGMTATTPTLPTPTGSSSSSRKPGSPSSTDIRTTHPAGPSLTILMANILTTGRQRPRKLRKLMICTSMREKCGSTPHLESTDGDLLKSACFRDPLGSAARRSSTLRLIFAPFQLYTDTSLILLYPRKQIATNHSTNAFCPSFLRFIASKWVRGTVF